MASIRHPYASRTSQPSQEDIVIPETYAEALASPQAAEWKVVAHAEFSSLIYNRTWRLMKKPDGAIVG
jgi:hypothetical protein